MVEALNVGYLFTHISKWISWCFIDVQLKTGSLRLLELLFPQSAVKKQIAFLHFFAGVYLCDLHTWDRESIFLRCSLQNLTFFLFVCLFLINPNIFFIMLSKLSAYFSYPPLLHVVVVCWVFMYCLYWVPSALKLHNVLVVDLMAIKFHEFLFPFTICQSPHAGLSSWTK